VTKESPNRLTVEAVSLLISGKVQGVFFRSTLKNIADENGVKGWVRNLADGRVEALVQGVSGDVGRVVKWCKVGPRGAVVEDVEIRQVSEKTGYRNFSVLH
jgi:acylphosphatase